MTSLLLLSVMLRSKKPLSSYQSLIKRYPQVLINVAVKKKQPFAEIKAVQAALTSAEEKLGKRGRILLRYSGTEPKARVMVECEDAGVCQSVAENVAETVKKELAA